MDKKLEELNQRVKESAENYLSVILKQAEDRLLLEMVTISIKSAENTEKIVNYLLLVSGATLPLFISNSDKLLKVLGSGTFKFLLIFLLLAAIVGFLSKISLLLATKNIGMYDNALNRTKEIMDEYYEFEREEIEKTRDIIEVNPRKSKDLNEFYSDLKEMYPAKSQYLFFSKNDTTLDDGKATHKKATFLLSWHYKFLIAQIFFILLSFIITIFGMEI